MRSEARARLSEQIAKYGENGRMFVRNGPREATADGPDLPPGTMAYPPCECPIHRGNDGTSDASDATLSIEFVQVKAQSCGSAT